MTFRDVRCPECGSLFLRAGEDAAGTLELVCTHRGGPRATRMRCQWRGTLTLESVGMVVGRSSA